MPDFDPRVLLRSEETGGEVSLVWNTVPANWDGPPLHRHDFDETFFVLDGELTFQLGDAIRTAGPGELVFALRGRDHTLANLSDAAASYLLLCTPGGFERYFARVEAERAGDEPPEWAMLPVPDVMTVGPTIGGNR